MHRVLFHHATAVLLLLSGTLAFADDWPQWLGPQRDSVWREEGVMGAFPAGGATVRWRAAIGAGYSGPIVAKGFVYVTDRQLGAGSTNSSDPFQRGSVQGQERVLCFNEADGKPVWNYAYDTAYTVSYPAGPRVAPLVYEGRVYSLGAEGKLVCLDALTGKDVWVKDFKNEFNIKTPMWGFAGHPLIYSNLLICLAGGPGTTVIAFDRNTGKEQWRALSAEEPGYSSPILCQAGGRSQVIVFDPESINSLDPQSGRVLWSVPFKSNTGLSVATPRQLGDELFCTSFYNGSIMLRLDAAAPGASVLWQTHKANERDTTHLNAILCTPFFMEGHIYGVCSYGQLRCLEADTGRRVWETFQATTGGEPVRWANAFMVKNGDRFFLFNEKGDLIIAKLSPSGYQEISRAHILDPTNKDCGRPVVWSHPAFANRCAFARNDKELVCVDLAAKQ